MTVTTEAPTTRGQALAADLRSQTSLSYDGRALFPSVWNSRLHNLFAEQADRIMDNRENIRRQGTFDAVDQVLLDFFPEGNDFRSVITAYPTVLSRWLYDAVERAMTVPLAAEQPSTAVHEAVETTTDPTGQRTWQVGDRLRITGTREYGMATMPGDVVEILIIHNPRPEGHQYATVVVRESATARVGIEYGLYSSHARLIEDEPAPVEPALRPVREDEWRVGLELVVTGSDSGGVTFPVGSRVTVDSPGTLQNTGTRNVYGHVSGTDYRGREQRRYSLYLRDLSVPETPEDTVESLRAEVARLRAIVEAVQSAVAPF